MDYTQFYREYAQFYRELLTRDPVEFMRRCLHQVTFRLVLKHFIKIHNYHLARGYNASEIEIAITYDALAEEVGICLERVSKAIKRLTKLGLISYETRRDATRRRGINVYKVSEWLFEASLYDRIRAELDLVDLQHVGIRATTKKVL